MAVNILDPDEWKPVRKVYLRPKKQMLGRKSRKRVPYFRLQVDKCKTLKALLSKLKEAEDNAANYRSGSEYNVGITWPALAKSFEEDIDYVNAAIAKLKQQQAGKNEQE